MNPGLPTRLRNALAGLLLEAIGERGGPADSRIAMAGIVLLKAYGDLAHGARGTVSLRALRARARRSAPHRTDDLEAALARLYPEYLERHPGARGAEDRVSLHGAAGPHAARLYSQISAYTEVLQRAAALPALPPEPVGRGIVTAALLFNAGLYFEAHEILEVAWRIATGDVKTFTQGWLQIAVALHHAHAGNPSGAWTLLHKGADKLRCAPTAIPALDTTALLAQLVPWERHLANAIATGTHQSHLPHLPPPPQVRLSPYVP